MKEFTFSVLLYLRSRVRKELAYLLPVFLRAYLGVVYFQQEKPQQQKSISAKNRKSNRCDVLSVFSGSSSNDYVSVARAALFARERIHTTSNMLAKNGIFLDKIENLINTPPDVTTATKVDQSTQMPQHCAIDRHLPQGKRSRIIASLHFGKFIYCLYKSLCWQSKTSKKAALNQRESSGEYIENYTIAFGQKGACFHNQTLLDEVDVGGLSEFLRDSSRRLLMFADLPSGFVQTIDVKLLGRNAVFRKSTALLSLSNSVLIFPVICSEEGDSHQIKMGRQIEPLTREGETRADAVSRMTQLQVDFFQHFFLRHNSL